MLFHAKTQKGVRIASAILAFFIIVSMVMFFMPGIFQ